MLYVKTEHSNNTILKAGAFWSTLKYFKLIIFIRVPNIYSNAVESEDWKLKLQANFENHTPVNENSFVYS